MSKGSWVYKITCAPTGKFYIGSTADKRGPNTRWAKHSWELNKNIHSNTHLQRAWNKYGKTNFTFSIIEQVSTDVTLVREQFYIDTQNPSFNMCRVSGTTKGIKHPPRSQESRDKISKVLKGRVGTRKGMKVSQETRDKISRSKTGKKMGPRSEEWRRKIGDAQRGYRNHMYGKRFKGKPKPRGFHSLYSTPIRDQNGMVYGSQAEAARILGLFQSNIYRVLKKVIRQTGGYHFEYT